MLARSRGITPINQHLKTGGYGIRPYETTRILLTPLSFRPKINGPKKETPTADGLCHRQILGAPPQAWADHVRTPPIGRKKTFSQKGFCGAFSLKKRPSAPQRPRPQAASPINQNLIHSHKSQSTHYKKFPNPLYEDKLL